MSSLLQNSFTAYKLNPREELEGRTFNIAQSQYLQNRLALLAEEKLRWIFDPTKVLESSMKQAELTGQILLLQSLLLDSESAAHELNTLVNSGE